MTQHDDLLYVALMRDEVRGVLEVLDGCSWDAFMTDARRQHAAAYHFMRLAERPLKVSPVFRAEHGEIPWDDLARVCERVEPEALTPDPAAMWEISTMELPGTLGRLEALLPASDLWRYRDEDADGDEPDTPDASERFDVAALARLGVSAAVLDEICRRYDVRRIRLFGSVLRDDFVPQSDVDVMVDFGPDAPRGWSVLALDEELTALFGHKADVMHGRPVRYIRRRILAEARTVYLRTDEDLGRETGSDVGSAS
jgi:predicted nucleotidyltransferase/uncharacterized protein with HEPN domain